MDVHGYSAQEINKYDCWCWIQVLLCLRNWVLRLRSFRLWSSVVMWGHIKVSEVHAACIFRVKVYRFRNKFGYIGYLHLQCLTVQVQRQVSLYRQVAKTCMAPFLVTCLHNYVYSWTYILHSLRRKQHVSPKRRHPPTKLQNGTITKKTISEDCSNYEDDCRIWDSHCGDYEA
jgi:hypothetical protein